VHHCGSFVLTLRYLIGLIIHAIVAHTIIESLTNIYELAVKMVKFTSSGPIVLPSTGLLIFNHLNLHIYHLLGIDQMGEGVLVELLSSGFALGALAPCF